MNLAPKTAIGLMSGTSCDGVDAALIKTDGNTILSSGPYIFVPFQASEQAQLQKAMKDVAACSTVEKRLEAGLFVENMVTDKHSLAVKQLLKETSMNPDDIDVVGFHGQTMFHDPKAGYTLQIGNGEQLAKKVGIPVVYDFRSRDMQFGGQGAPLVPSYHQALARLAHKTKYLEFPLVVLNIGGVANISYIGGIEGKNQGDNELLAFDTGPGNALLNDWVKRHTGEKMDEGGKYASAGCVHQGLVDDFLSHAYFKKSPPKSLDRNDFLVPGLEGLTLKDGAATLTQITIETIKLAQNHMPDLPKQWVVVGGGAMNAEMMRRLKTVVTGKIIASDDLGWNGEFIEAEAFGFLAVRHVAGLPYTFPGTTGVSKPVCGGLLARI